MLGENWKLPSGFKAEPGGALDSLLNLAVEPQPALQGRCGSMLRAVHMVEAAEPGMPALALNDLAEFGSLRGAEVTDMKCIGDDSVQLILGRAPAHPSSPTGQTFAQQMRTLGSTV